MTYEIVRWLADHARTELAAISVLAAVISLGYAVRTYQANAKTKRAEFLMQLHRAFFVEPTYKRIRNLLDDDSETARAAIKREIEQETAELTDFLNFFELVAYFGNCGTLLPGDVLALLEYYLDLLKKNSALANYIGTNSKSFGNLKKLLGLDRG